MSLYKVLTKIIDHTCEVCGKVGTTFTKDGKRICPTCQMETNIKGTWFKFDREIVGYQVPKDEVNLSNSLKIMDTTCEGCGEIGEPTYIHEGHRLCKECLKESPTKEIGVKFDEGKLDWTLIPWEPMEEVVKALMHGATKYGRDNWKDVVPKNRYDKVALRHRIEYQKGNKIDKDSGLNHLAHEICSSLFKLWEDLQNDE